jgi:LacI family transcriptional regulator
MLSGDAAGRRAILGRIAALRQPIVLIQDVLPAAIADGASVLQDDIGGARAIAAHLFDRNARHAAFLAPAIEWPAMARREQGLRDVLAERRSAIAFHVVQSADEGFAATQAALAAHVARHGAPDILIGGNDQMAIAGMRLLMDRGLSIPRDVRVAGFNGLEFWRYATPELSTVFSPAYALGETAADALLARLDDGAFPFREKILPVRFAPHGSSEVLMREIARD